jgi:hypothetical protein
VQLGVPSYGAAEPSGTVIAVIVTAGSTDLPGLEAGGHAHASGSLMVRRELKPVVAVPVGAGELMR